MQDLKINKKYNTNKNNKHSFVFDDHDFFECEMGSIFLLAMRPPMLRLGSRCKLIYGRTHTSDACVCSVQHTVYGKRREEVYRVLRRAHMWGQRVATKPGLQ